MRDSFVSISVRMTSERSIDEILGTGNVSGARGRGGARIEPRGMMPRRNCQ
jgi:hypothetical protein